MVTDNTNQADDTTAFLRAARSGNLEKVVEFLDTDLDIDTANSNGLNALHLASKDGHVEIVTELLKRGAKVDAATKKGNTALHIASLAGQAEIVNILIQYGAAVNIQSQNGFTPLYMAAQENHDQVVKLLLSNGANQSLATEDGFTPLAVAMQQGHDKVVSVLLENDSKGKVKLPALHIAAKKDDCKAADLLLQNDHKPDVTSKSGFTPLHIAAHYGNEEIARLLILRGADVNYPAKHNITPLHVAAKWGKNNMVKILLENSAMIDAKTRDALTPLHCAARSGHEQVVATLLEQSAPISARTKNGLAPLHMASQGDHVEAARVLLYHRAPVDEVTVDYLTSLHVAAHCGHVRVAKLLLDRKADPNARALNGFTPLHIACKKNRIKVVELLLKHGASIESTTESGLTPLHVASFMGCMNIVIFLLQHEANPDVPTIRGETALHLAARANQTDIIRILLRNGAKVDARAREEQTPLHIASRLGNIDIVMLLLQHGAAVDTTTKDMYTALHIAAKEGQEEVAAILVENNASINATTKKGYTPLHIAAKYGNMNVAKILLQKDSELDARGKNDITPLQLACRYDHPNVANLLLEKGASPHLASQNGHTPLHIAARKNQMDIASTLLENGANPNAKSKSGFTPLHLSAQMGHYDMTNLLIEHGADPDQKAKNGCTALHLCAQENFTRVASVLVKNGADLESKTETGYRPLHVAAHFGNLPMIRFLLKHNAEVDVRTSKNYTPLHQAAQQGHAHIVTALLEGNASHKARTNDGLTALNIAQKLGYISVMEVLKGLSYDTLAPDNKNWEEKYKVIAPESLQETSFMSDSDEEGESDALVSEQPYHLTADLMKNLRDDSLPIDVTRDDPLHKHVAKEEKQEFIQSNNYCLAENLDSTDGLNLGRLHFRSFLVSFLVDARGGTMKGCRHSGVRIIIPPRRATMPIRVTCRLVKPSKLPNPPPLMEGEALATRVIEMGPVGASFLGPVSIDIPHFASVRGKEREIIILRSENGETWKEHDNSADNDDSLLNTPYDSQMSATHSGRITRIVTTEFPQYFAIITRIKQEVHVIGAEGGILISSVANHVQAVFPPGALTKKIKVGLQAHVIPAELTAKLLGNCVAVSPVITIEPRRRKFHKPITLTIPVPQAANKGMINQYGGETPTLRLLCSIAGGTSEAQWEDVTGSTPLTFMNDRVSFTTTVSARFWLMDCRNISEVPKMATELYKESVFVPYITNFVIYSKRMDVLEATLRILCMTDGKEGIHTLEKQEEFLEIVKSRDVEALDGKDLYIEFSGNLVPVTKSGVQLKFTFKAFRQNRLSFHVKVKDPLLDPVARMLFMREPKVAKGEPSQQPICVLNIVLPEIQNNVEIHKKLEGYEDSNIIDQKMDYYKSKYKLDGKEKCDEPKYTSPTEQKFITDTLQKEQTDAATIHESFAQKAACPLESVDASYPNKVGEEVVGESLKESEELSPGFERQTYSEKRRFWEDISKKRESYQRSESEVSRASQLTINESESDYPQDVTGEETTFEMEDIKQEIVEEDLNVPDISECSVAEKAHYFEEQIQREMQSVGKLQQQDSVKSDKEKPSKTLDEEEISMETYVVDGRATEKKLAKEITQTEKSLEEKERGEKESFETKEMGFVEEKEQEVLTKEEVKEISEKVMTKTELADEAERKPLKEIREECVRKAESFESKPIKDIRGEFLKTTETIHKEIFDIDTVENIGAKLPIKTEMVVKKTIETIPVKDIREEIISKTEMIETKPAKAISEELVVKTETIVKETIETESIPSQLLAKLETTETESVKDGPTKSVTKQETAFKDEIEQKDIPIEFVSKPQTMETMETKVDDDLLVTEEIISKDEGKTQLTKKIEILPVKKEPVTAASTFVEEKVMDDKIIHVKTTKIVEEYVEGTKDKPERTKMIVEEIVTEYQVPVQTRKGAVLQSAIEKEVVKEESIVSHYVQETSAEEKETTEQRKQEETVKEISNLEIKEVDAKTETVPTLDVKKEVESFLEQEKIMHEGIPESYKTETQEETVDSFKGGEPSVQKELSQFIGESPEKEDEIQKSFTSTQKLEMKLIKKEYESRIPISAAKAEKEKGQKETKGKISPDSKSTPVKVESPEMVSPETPKITSPGGKKKEFESKIPKWTPGITKPAEKDAKKDEQKKDQELITVTEKKSREEVTSTVEEHSTTKKSEIHTFTKTFTDPKEALKAFENIDTIKDKDYTAVTSTVDYETSKTVEKKEILSEEILAGPEKVIVHEEKERVERKKSSESKVTVESPSETVEKKEKKTEETDETTIQKMSMNFIEGSEVIDASASQSKMQSKEEQSFKSLEDKEGITTQESGVTKVKESDVDVAVRIHKDQVPEGVKLKEEADKSTIADDVLGKIETTMAEEKHKESTDAYDVTQFVPSEKADKTSTLTESKTVKVHKTDETLEEQQRRKAEELQARTLAEDLLQSIESEIEKRSEDWLQKGQVKPPSKKYYEETTVERRESDHEKLADDLTRKFENIMKKSMDDQEFATVADLSKVRTSLPDEALEKSSTRDSISLSEDLTKDEESSYHEKEDSLEVSSLQARLPDRDITMSPSSISEQIEFEETMELEDSSKSEKRPATSSDLAGCARKDAILAKETIVSELSGARVLEILEPEVCDRSREDSVDVPSLEMDVQRISDQQPRGSLHESAAVDSLEKICQERDITISPSTVSEDSSMMPEYPVQREDIPAKRADSFEIESPQMLSPRLKARGLAIEPVNWMIGDEKIEISETLQPSQAFDKELEEYEMKQQSRMSSREASTDLESVTTTKSSEEMSTVESIKEIVTQPSTGEPCVITVTKTSKFTVLPVNEPDFDSELIENKLDISCQELVDTLQREYDAKTPTEDYAISIKQGFQTREEEIDSEDSARSDLKLDLTIKGIEVEISDVTEKDHKLSESEVESKTTSETLEPSVTKEKEEYIPPETIESVETTKTEKADKQSVPERKEQTDEKTVAKPSVVENVSKPRTDSIVIKVKADDQRRRAEKTVDKHEKPGRSATGVTVPDTCAFKIKKDDYPNVDLSARYAITVLDQVVKKEIAEVKESLEAVKQDLIEELSENSETIIQIKDSPSEFQFKLQPESIPNDLPFLYRPPSLDREPIDHDCRSTTEGSTVAKPRSRDSKKDQKKASLDKQTADALTTEEKKKTVKEEIASKEEEKETVKEEIASKEEEKETVKEEIASKEEEKETVKEEIASKEEEKKEVKEEIVLKEEEKETVKQEIASKKEEKEKVTKEVALKEQDKKCEELVEKYEQEKVEKRLEKHSEEERHEESTEKELKSEEEKDIVEFKKIKASEDMEKETEYEGEGEDSIAESLDKREIRTSIIIETDDAQSEIETGVSMFQDDAKIFEEDRPSPIPASRSGSDVEYKDESSSLAPPQPAPRRRHKSTRASKKVASESEGDLGSSSGDSSNYQSCDYESSSRPSSSDVEALQSAAGIPSGTCSEYETAMMSVEHSTASKPTSQEYHTAATTLSSRESMKSLNSLSSGHLGSIDSTSEQLSETLVPSEPEMDRDFIDEGLERALDEEGMERSDSSESDIPIDEPVDKIDSNIPCRMKRSSEMIFQQIIDDDATIRDIEEPEMEVEENVEHGIIGVDSSTLAFDLSMVGEIESVDIMTSRVSEDGVQSVCTQVISKQSEEAEKTVDFPEMSREEESKVSAEQEVLEKSVEEKSSEVAETQSIETVPSHVTSAPTGTEENLESAQGLAMTPQASMSTSSASGISADTIIEKDRHSPDSDSFELVDKPDIIDDFVVIEEVGREAEEYDSEGKGIRISAIPQVSTKNYDRDLENLITETKKAEDAHVSTSQTTKNNELFDFESEESPPQASNDEQYSQSYSDEEQYEGGKKWIEMQFQDTRVYDIEYDRGPLEDIKEEEITDFEAGSSRFGSLGSQKESIGSVGSMRGSFGSTPEYDLLAGKKFFTKPTDHDNVSLSSLQEFEHLESAVAAENSKRFQCGSQESSNNGSLPRRYTTGRSGHGDDISLSSLKDFEGLEKACREAHLIELRAREEEDLLEHESPENKYKLELVARAKMETSVSAAGSINPSTSGSDDYEKRIKEIDEIIRIAQSNVEKFERQDDTTEDISQLEMERVTSHAITGSTLPEESEAVHALPKDVNVMETSTDSLELEENVDKKHHPLCRSSDSLEMKTTLDIPSLSSDSLNNVRDAKESQVDSADQYNSARRISSDSLDIPLLEQQDPETQEQTAENNGNFSDKESAERFHGELSSGDTSTARSGKTKPSTNGGT